METQIIDGKKIAADIRAELKKRIAKMNPKPVLAVILVGDDPASQIYVRHKITTGKEIGVDVKLFQLSPVMTEEALIAFIQDLNADESVHGMIVQLPLPKHMDTYRVLESIRPEKDADGLCSVNLGRLFVGRPALVPCTPLACMELIRRACPNPDGLRAVIVGRSSLVGKPVAQLLMDAQCTITEAHSHTQNLAEVCRGADILVVATGKTNLIRANFIKPGAVVIDVGINRNKDGKLCGDVVWEEALGVAGAITPVPGGVGPMTVTMLMSNVVDICEKAQKKA